MAATVTILAVSESRAVVKVTGTAANDTATIALSSLIHTTLPQTASSPKANIVRVWYSVASGGNVTIVRNSVTVLNLYGHDTISGFSLAEQNGSDVVVTFVTSAGGTAILEFSKVGGYLGSLANP